MAETQHRLERIVLVRGALRPSLGEALRQAGMSMVAVVDGAAVWLPAAALCSPIIAQLERPTAEDHQ